MVWNFESLKIHHPSSQVLLENTFCLWFNHCPHIKAHELLEYPNIFHLFIFVCFTIGMMKSKEYLNLSKFFQRWLPMKTPCFQWIYESTNPIAQLLIRTWLVLVCTSCFAFTSIRPVCFLADRLYIQLSLTFGTF